MIQLFDLGLTGRDIERQFVVELQRLFIKQVERFDVFQQRMLMRQQVVGDPVDLALHLFETGGELGKGRGTAQQFLPPALLAPHVQFRDREAADRADHGAQAVARGANILVTHIRQHGLADLLQLGLRGRAEADDGLGIGHVDLGHALLDFRALFGIGFVQRHDGIGIRRFRQDGCVHFFHQPLRLGSFVTEGIGHH